MLVESQSPVSQSIKIQFSTDRNYAFVHYGKVLSWLKATNKFTDGDGNPVKVTSRGIEDMRKILVTLWRLAQAQNSSWRCENGLTAFAKGGECRKSWDFIIDALAQNFPDTYTKRKLEYRVRQLHRVGLLNWFQDPKPGMGKNIPGAKRFFGYGPQCGRFNNYWKVIAVVPLRCLGYLRELFTSSISFSLQTISEDFRGVESWRWYYLDLKELWALARMRKMAMNR